MRGEILIENNSDDWNTNAGENLVSALGWIFAWRYKAKQFFNWKIT